MQSSDFVNDSYDYRPNWTPLSPVTITNIECFLIKFSFVSPQICDDQSHRVFFAKMTSCAVRYDVIYHPFPINSQLYLKKMGVDSPE